MATFKNLVRVAIGQQAHYGELVGIANKKYTVQQLRGTPFDGLVPTNDVHEFESVSEIFQIFEQENGELNIHASFYRRLKKPLSWFALG